MLVTMGTEAPPNRAQRLLFAVSAVSRVHLSLTQCRHNYKCVIYTLYYLFAVPKPGVGSLGGSG